MKAILSAITFLILSPALYSQSGRRAKETKIPVPPPVEQESEEAKLKIRRTDEASQVTAERNEDYKCTDDGSLARILDAGTDSEQTFTSKQVDVKAAIVSKPKPSYTREARRAGVQGYVIIRVLLTADGKIGRVRVVRGLPAGLTENAIRAACEIEFKPAIKNGRPVSQWVAVEYGFRLAD